MGHLPTERDECYLCYRQPECGSAGPGEALVFRKKEFLFFRPCIMLLFFMTGFLTQKFFVQYGSQFQYFNMTERNLELVPYCFIKYQTSFDQSHDLLNPSCGSGSNQISGKQRRTQDFGGRGEHLPTPPPLPKAKHVFIYHTYDMDDMVAANWHDGYQCCGAGAGLFSRCR